jgi:hypothetical protein
MFPGVLIKNNLDEAMAPDMMQQKKAETKMKE